MKNSIEPVYVFCDNAYSLEYRPANDPSLVAARSNYHTLPVTKCNEVFKGPSKFVEQSAEEFYRQTSNIADRHQLEKSHLSEYSLQRAGPPQMRYQKKNSMSTTEASQMSAGCQKMQSSFHGGEMKQGINKSIPQCQAKSKVNQLAKSDIIWVGNKSTNFNETNYSEVVSSSPAYKQNSLECEADLIQVVSEDQIENDNIQKLKTLLTQKNQQIAQFRQEINRRDLREQVLENKLKIIQQIAGSGNGRNQPECRLRSELNETWSILQRVSVAWGSSNSTS